MRKLKYSAICMVLSLWLAKDLVGQQAEFETSFFFEDAVGNKDTIILGADTSADFLENIHLGETLLTDPWDEEFEVRVAERDNYHFYVFFGDPLYLYNKRIQDLPFIPDCGFVSSVIFLMHTNHYPVTVTWDTSIWSSHNTECNFDGAFFHHTDETLEPFWWTGFDWHYTCLGTRSNYQFDTTHTDPYSGIIDSVNGVGMQFIYGLQLASHEFENPISPCQSVVSTNDQGGINTLPYIIYPNPASDFIIIKLPNEIDQSGNEVNISIRNSQGLEILELRNFNSRQIYLDDIPNGIYFATATVRDKLYYVSTQKFVVIHN